jgi:plastocyanin
VEVEFTPNIVGEFEYYCSVGDHRAKGMTGTIIVE